MTDREKKADTITDSVIFFFLPSVKYYNIRSLFTHQAKVYCNDINGCHDNGRRVDDNILLRLLEQEITALFRIRDAPKKKERETNTLSNAEEKLNFCNKRCIFFSS